MSRKWKSAISSNDVQSSFVSNLGETGIETFNKLKQAYGEHALSRSQVFKYYKAFSEGRESIKDDPRSGRPSTSKTDIESVSLLYLQTLYVYIYIIYICVLFCTSQEKHILFRSPENRNNRHKCPKIFCCTLKILFEISHKLW